MTLSGSTDAAWSIAVSGHMIALPAGAMRWVGAIGPVTPLPFVPDWIEGLVNVADRPVLLIDPGRAPGGPGGGGTGDKLVLLDLAGTAIALRVERVVSSAGLSSAPWPIDRLVEHLSLRKPAGVSDYAAGPAATSPATDNSVLVLVVADGTTRAGILIDDGLSVGTVAACAQVGPDQLVATIGDHLLAASHLTGARGANLAVIGPAGDALSAVLVERLIGLVRIPRTTLTLLPAATAGRNLCFPMADCGPVILFDFPTLVAGSRAAGAPAPASQAYRHLLERVRDDGMRAVARSLKGMTAPAAETERDGNDGGVIVSVRGVRWLLPFGMVERMLGPDERPVAGNRPVSGHSVPLVDATRWFPPGNAPAPASRTHTTVTLRLGGRVGLALRVDHVTLEAAGSGRPWLPPPALPPGLAALVGAVRAEPGTSHWCLRLQSGLDPTSIPASLRRAVAAAVVGRLAPAAGPPINLQGT